MIEGISFSTAFGGHLAQALLLEGEKAAAAAGHGLHALAPLRAVPQTCVCVCASACMAARPVADGREDDATAKALMLSH